MEENHEGLPPTARDATKAPSQPELTASGSGSARGSKKMGVWLLIGTTVALITGLLFGWFDHFALGWFSIAFFLACFVVFGILVMISLARSRRE